MFFMVYVIKDSWQRYQGNIGIAIQNMLKVVKLTQNDKEYLI